MSTCPAGHQSAAGDYCDQCGRRMGGAPETPAAAAGSAGSGLTAGEHGSGQPGGGHASGRQASGTDGSGTDGSGTDGSGTDGSSTDGSSTDGSSTDGATPPGPPGPAGAQGGATPLAPPGSDGTAWWAVVGADRLYFDHVVAVGGPEAAAIAFPAYCPERRFSLGTSRAGEEKQIGRHSASRGISPAIDLTGPPADPGVSRLHAVLIGQADGGWAVLDPGSENGTLVNDQEIPVGVQVPLHDGDRIHLGAWTSITIRRGSKAWPPRP